MHADAGCVPAPRWISGACGSTVSCQLPRGIGTITTWYGATRGGRTSPLSSPCVMIDAADQARRDAPRRASRRAARVLSRAWNWISNALAKFCPRLCDVPGLQRAAVAHQRLDRVGLRRAGELLALALLPVDDRHRQHVLGRTPVDVEHLQRLFLALPPRSRARCALPARGTRSCAGTAASPSPSARRWPTG